MKITKGTVVELTYQVRTKDNVLVDEATENSPLKYLHGAKNLIQGLEDKLENLKANEEFNVEVTSDNAYGSYNDNLVQEVDKKVFDGGDDLEIGMRFIAETDNGNIPVEITAVSETTVTVDGNHILAGQDLFFTGKILSVREATSEELAHGHVHGSHDENEDESCNSHSCGSTH